MPLYIKELLFVIAGAALFAAVGAWLDSRPSDPASFDLERAASLRQLWLAQARICDRDSMVALRSANELERLWATDLTDAPPDLIARAERGDAEARAVLVIFNYARGNDPISDPDLGAALLAAAEDGSPTAMNEVGNAHLTGELGFPVDPAIAEHWLRQAAAAGEHIAMATLARSYLNGDIPASEDDVNRRLQLASDAALMAASVCDVHGLHLIGTWLNSQMTEPYDPAAAVYFQTLVPEAPQGNYLPDQLLAPEQMPDIDAGDQEENE
ncbi:SEL1-like repeat protein [Hyphobacterium sp. HN65]|uniref:SEL1-like repeat protein n=1 Tax=Hyphobacterium lacteum TaxID=3116575 RepID=A0ABU7LQ96_9PROT|nr:SEL1-like repeat protein [Hyphobacterium sp. HN65]MEE2526085.1 SEL1-like repeat protein [Hyphobacterium sp. HN65]